MYDNSTFSLATATWKSFLREKIFYAVILVSFLILSFSYLLATLTIIESRKLLLDFGFAAISLSGIMIAVFIGVFAISKELEMKTIYTVLSKPVSRSSFLLGKYIGCLFILSSTHVFLGVVLSLVVKVAGESIPNGFIESIFLTLLESSVILSVAFLFSIITSGFFAGSLSLAIFLIGRSSVSVLAMTEKASTPEVRALARGVYWIFPNLERYNIRDVVAYGRDFPGEMISNAGIYTILYTAFCLGLAILLLDRKEIP